MPNVQVSIFPIGNWRRRYNSAALPRSLWWGVCEYAALPSSRLNSSAPLVCRHDRVTGEARHVGLVGRDIEDEGILSDVVPVYLYFLAFNVSVSLGV